jgi:class 3 adenylate cyclase
MTVSAPLPRTVLFADLRGSTALYETLGNSEAATVVSQSVSLLGQVVINSGGRVVKTLGDGLLAVFDAPENATLAADEMHESLDRIGDETREGPVLKLKGSIALGELIDVDGDCFGDAVNVAARLLELAADHETLCTESLVHALPTIQRERFRSLDRIRLRGRQEPVGVYRLEPRSFSDSISTVLDTNQGTHLPDGIRVCWQHEIRIFSGVQLPLILGRNPQATCFVDDSRVSRTHARIDWHGGNFQLTDLSSNGTYVTFQGQTETVSLRRGTCTLHGAGTIWLGAAPTSAHHFMAPPTVRFEVISFSDTAKATLP